MIPRSSTTFEGNIDTTDCRIAHFVSFHAQGEITFQHGSNATVISGYESDINRLAAKLKEWGYKEA